ncbi:hypothetical protein O6H91_10G005900 [Diphasiastrum complanatum]|uniref:Uncharacterized protein n=1 Tax=Diphasiastrum complanatum TaxID=34168 RepID=A0ACC2CDY1_DIPCM|nr:hypothetical protein O6H91_10G005900 [Diphasiastrum complanatum]
MEEQQRAMEVLRSHLTRVRIPEPSTRIYKQECCISFDSPRSEGGLFVDLNSFTAYGRDYVTWNYQKNGNPVYLNIKEVPKPESDNRPRKKPTLLAIGLEGGFDAKQQDYEEIYSIVILPEFLSLPFPNVDLPEKFRQVRLSVEAVLASVGAERKEQVAAWTADKKKVSPFAHSLPQLDNGVLVPPSGWKCSKCEKTENLWLNLTDGVILCGRRNWDGTGGNNHAVEHFNATNYPLAVKLGTITSDLENADVYSYPEDETVEDPFLAQHLAHFGIDFSSLKKTEMTTAERELDQNVNFDWNRIQENDKHLEPLFGPGYTGLINLGNSCYLASVVQMIFATRDFQLRYYENLNLDDAFQLAPADPTLDLNTQMTKLAHGLLSGKYSAPEKQVSEKDVAEGGTEKLVQNGISPRMFKSLIGAGHPEFATSRQQDALEFFQHLIEQVERSNSANPSEDPSRCFNFVVEEKIMCSASGKVKYTKKIDNVLSLNIPLSAAVNKGEVAIMEKTKAQKLPGEKGGKEDYVRPRVPLSACLESFCASEAVQDFYSSAIRGRTTAIKTAGLATFPEYLVLHMRKFTLEAGWVPKKLDVFIDVPDIVDISYMRSKGLQPGEEVLPETDGSPAADEMIVSKLMEMGFSRNHCEKAAINTSNTGLEPAMNWLLSHLDDPDIDTPLITKTDQNAQPVDEDLVTTLIGFGFHGNLARKALRETNGDVERAAEWIFSHSEEANSADMDISSGSNATGGVDKVLPDGPGKYKLLGFVSHMGTSTQSGHYVVHIRKDGRWVIFNDCKVAVSSDPPKDMGYLYFFQRIHS